MRDIFIGVIVFGLILKLTSFLTDDDERLYKSYLEKKGKNQHPTSIEALVYWVRMAVFSSNAIVAIGLLGLIFHYVLI